MAKQKLGSIYITCEEVDGKEAFRVEVTHKAKQTLSQRKGWVPSSYQEPDKFTCTSVDCLCKKIKEVAGDCSK
jgi:hypothetical protein